MKAAYSTAPVQDNTVNWCVENPPFQFCGPPTNCVGKLTFTNRSAEKIKIRELIASAIDKKTDKKSALTWLSPTILCRAKIPAQTQVSVMAKLQLHPATPPGKYDIQVHVGEHCYPACVQVTADENLQITPRRLNFEGASGDTVSQCVTFENFGNVPVSLQDLSMVWLEEKNWGGHTIVQTIRDTPTDADYTGYLNTLLKNFQNSMVAPAKVELSPSTPDVVNPGQIIEKTVSLVLPPGLKKGKTYHGFIKVRRYRIWIALYCNGSPNSSIRR
jgi:hypothetical protein